MTRNRRPTQDTQQGETGAATATDARTLSLRLNEAVEHHRAGRLLEAEEIYRRILDADPEHPQALCRLGVIAHAAGQNDQALDLITRAIAAKPDYADAHGNFGVVLLTMGRSEEALASLDNALALDPDNVEAHSNKGVSLRSLGRPEDAVASYRHAIKIWPEHAEAHFNLGNVLNETGRPEDAVASYRRATAIKPDYAEVYHNLGHVLTNLEDLEEAVAHFKQAFTLKPDYYTSRCNYLHTLLYLPDITNAEMFDAYREVVLGDPSVHRAGDSASQSPPALMLSPGKRLRIGYLSSDFREHPVGRNVLPLLSHHDHDRFEIFCYAELGAGDGLTERFRGDADHWRVTRGLSDAEVAALIRDDAIHVMVYLGGHFDENRPSVAAWRPAPVQVAMHGGATTALDEMDFWLTDAVLHPPEDAGGTTERFTEELFRLPNFYAYPALDSAPPVSALPAETNGYITFASFNKPHKINATVVDLWSRVLTAAPGSRLMLKYKNHWDGPTLREKVLGRFEANGVSAARIDLISATDTYHDHLACYHKADIALDTFPFSGATTTFQALWMGVPVISLMRDRFIARMGGSITTHIGLGDLAVDSEDAFVETAVALAADLPRLADLRATLRQILIDSSLCDGPAYARNVEDAFRAMWDAHTDKDKAS